MDFVDTLQTKIYRFDYGLVLERLAAEKEASACPAGADTGVAVQETFATAGEQGNSTMSSVHQDAGPGKARACQCAVNETTAAGAQDNDDPARSYVEEDACPATAGACQCVTT